MEGNRGSARDVSCKISGMASGSCGFPWEQRFYGYLVIWLFGQFRWSSCNKLALFSDKSDNHLIGALLEPSLPSRVERDEMLNPPSWVAIMQRPLYCICAVLGRF